MPPGLPATAAMPSRAALPLAAAAAALLLAAITVSAAPVDEAAPAPQLLLNEAPRTPAGGLPERDPRSVVMTAEHERASAALRWPGGRVWPAGASLVPCPGGALAQPATPCSCVGLSCLQVCVVRSPWTL